MGRNAVEALLLLLAVGGSAGGGGPERDVTPNHLIHEKSPYLLQHAYNPVEWYPWGEEAFEKARRQGKPILLSIGYSTCHWCHVMERESFSDPKTAALMNEHFVSIKLDREERPDVDKLYMTAVQAMTGQGGWPLNVFLTPDLKPFYGGTYFPPAARWGQPGWPQVLGRVAELWTTKRRDLESDAGRMTEALRRLAAAEGQAAAPAEEWLKAAYEGLAGSFDREEGGFGGAPKFPMPANLGFLLRYRARTGEEAALQMAVETLKAMARGGIYDQVGGGFHRYATDAQWRVPHFEKMLYDNAQLAAVYLEAYQLTRDPELARVARQTLDYVLRDMRHPEGGFYSAEDADSLPPEFSAAPGGKASPEAAQHGVLPHAEGAFYLWTVSEVRQALGDDAEVFIRRYGMKEGGNAPADPHGEFKGRNILYVRHNQEETAGKTGGRAKDLEARLDAARARLLELRARRPRPGLDDKVLTSWNGLMISALAKGAQVLAEPSYERAADAAARFLRERLYDTTSGRLHHRWRQGEKAVPGIADDYAFLIQGLLDLYEAGFDPAWLEWAVELNEAFLKLFAAPEGGFYLTSEDHDPRLLARVVEDTDNVEPAASSVAALNLLRLSQFASRRDLREAAERTLRRFGSRLEERPLSLTQMLAALDFALSKPRQIVIAGEPADEGARALLREVWARFMPVKILLRADSAAKPRLLKFLPFLKGVTPLKGRAAAYVCVDYACRLPTSDPAELLKSLEGR